MTETNCNELAAALATAQAEMKPAAMSGRNPHFKSKYATLADILDACRGPLSSNGLAIAQLPVNGEYGIGVTTILMHKSGQSISSTFFVPAQQNTPQGIGSALSYLRRYGLAAMVGVVADDDDDANAASTASARRDTRQVAAEAVAADRVIIPPADPAPEPAPANGKAPTSQAWANWYKAVAIAQAEGVTVPHMDDAADDADILKAGAQLKAAIMAARKAKKEQAA